MKMISASLILAYSLFISPVFAETTPLKVVTTFSILGDLTKQVGGDLVEVKTLVGPMETLTHTAQPPMTRWIWRKQDLLSKMGLVLKAGLTDWLRRPGTKVKSSWQAKAFL